MVTFEVTLEAFTIDKFYKDTQDKSDRQSSFARFLSLDLEINIVHSRNMCCSQGA